MAALRASTHMDVRLDCIAHPRLRQPSVARAPLVFKRKSPRDAVRDRFHRADSWAPLARDVRATQMTRERACVALGSAATARGWSACARNTHCTTSPHERTAYRHRRRWARRPVGRLLRTRERVQDHDRGAQHRARRRLHGVAARPLRRRRLHPLAHRRTFRAALRRARHRPRRLARDDRALDDVPRCPRRDGGRPHARPRRVVERADVARARRPGRDRADHRGSRNASQQ